MRGGYRGEAQAWRDWLLHRAVAGDPERAQIMYGISGEKRLVEWTADWLPDYGGAKPVRVGNAAAGQLQLDIFGVWDALAVWLIQTRRGRCRSSAPSTSDESGSSRTTASGKRAATAGISPIPR